MALSGLEVKLKLSVRILVIFKIVLCSATVMEVALWDDSNYMAEYTSVLKYYLRINQRI